MAKVFASIGGAFSYATRNTFKKPVQWILVAVIMVLEMIAVGVGCLYLSAAIVGSEITAAITSLLQSFGLSGLLALFPANNGGALIAIGVVGFVVALILGLFIYGLQVQIFAGKDITFAGFFGTVGRGFQALIISIIYEIVVVILMLLLTFGLGQATAVIGSTNPVGLIVALGAWAVLLLVLFFIFSIFMIPALINFARQGKFGAAFHFKEVGALIGKVKWYKIFLGIIIISIIVTVLLVVLILISDLLGMVPGVAGTILSCIFLALTYVYVFFLYASYWPVLFKEA